MADPHTEVEMDVIPDCDLCKQLGTIKAAYADVKLPSGPWAYVCEVHFAAHDCVLGLGRGQRLVPRRR